ncbi:DUF305 domain-containing protein [Actinomadura sp. NBRC 104412]|uniref:DUF305 domain-containing protein n=1 Tax=Actinomadura sp. NBRC 104412 TaxID=3032203 RepID=UPI0024A426DB|nr:DUF305 domain-containing protein [Actinomadura sp. NBRC 104412]GLZ06895.1 DUF305 domain-containing protein [Actinomadura sp. NBRC 104412]
MTAGTAPAPRGRRVAVVLAVLLVAATAFLWLRPGGPAADGPEAGFARDMSAHHAQAVRMSFIVRDRSKDERLRVLAYDIITTQSAQIGMMTAWLDEWRAPKADPSGPMRWMGGGHAGHGASPAGGMPGMATPAQLAQLERASGRDAEVLYLRLMIAHHRGGVGMARAVLARTDHPRVRRLAQTMVNAQNSEIALMNDMLRQRGAEAV